MKIPKDRVVVIEKGQVIPVLQAIHEEKNMVTFKIFDTIETHKIIPINIACNKCSFWKNHDFKNIQECQAKQKEDAIKRGFQNIICPDQLREA